LDVFYVTGGPELKVTEHDVDFVFRSAGGKKRERDNPTETWIGDILMKGRGGSHSHERGDVTFLGSTYPRMSPKKIWGKERKKREEGVRRRIPAQEDMSVRIETDFRFCCVVQQLAIRNCPGKEGGGGEGEKKKGEEKK